MFPYHQIRHFGVFQHCDSELWLISLLQHVAYGAIVKNLQTCCKEVVDKCTANSVGEEGLTYKMNRCVASSVRVRVWMNVCLSVSSAVLLGMLAGQLRREGKAALLCTICQI